jgi:hypothetical protein
MTKTTNLTFLVPAVSAAALALLLLAYPAFGQQTVTVPVPAQTVGVPQTVSVPASTVSVTVNVKGCTGATVSAAGATITVTCPPTTTTPPPPPPTSSNCGVSLGPSGGDDTANIVAASESAISKATCLLLTAGTWNVNELTPATAANIQLADGVTYKDVAALCGTVSSTGCGNGGGVLFDISNNNVTIAGAGPNYTALIEMPIAYAANLGPNQANNNNAEQYNHCFQMSNNESGFTLSHVTVTNCGGDSVNFSSGSNSTVSYVTSNSPLRQGLSITGGVNALTFTNDTWNTGGPGGGTGVDIEPDGDSAITNVVFNNNASNNNPTGAFSLGTYVTVKNQTTVTVNGWTSTGDKGGFFSEADGPGSFTVNNPTVVNSGGTCYTDSSYNYMTVIFGPLVCSNPNTAGSFGDSAQNGSGTLAAVAATYDPFTNTPTYPGNFNITVKSITAGSNTKAYYSFPSGVTNGCFNSPASGSLTGLSGASQTFQTGTCP